MRGDRGTLVSFHEGNKPETCIILAEGYDPDAMAEDILALANKQEGYRYSGVEPAVTVRRDGVRIVATAEGGNVDVVAEAMRARLLQEEVTV